MYTGFSEGKTPSVQQHRTATTQAQSSILLELTATKRLQIQREI